MPKMIFDIETSGFLFDSFDELTQKDLTKRIKKDELSEDAYALELDGVKDAMGLCPLTGEIITIGMYDCDKEKGIVLFQAPDSDIQAFEENGISYYPHTEREMIRIFWEKAKEYDEFVTYYGRGFDAPFLMMRSAIHKVKPSKDLMNGRYVYQQKATAKHIDLYDQLSFYGSFNEGKKSLHLYCNAFGIPTPKTSDISGAGVTQAFRDKKYVEIAKYNAADIVATKELYNAWDTYIRL